MWHCDAAGQYSDVSDQGFNTKGQNVAARLPEHGRHGHGQLHDHRAGLVLRSRRAHPLQDAHLAGRQADSEFTSQLFFDESQLTAIYADAPYAAHGTTPDRPNAADDIYNQTGGQTLLTLAQAGDGYSATIGIGIQA